MAVSFKFYEGDIVEIEDTADGTVRELEVTDVDNRGDTLVLKDQDTQTTVKLHRSVKTLDGDN